MSTKIEWTDETWNPISGCTKVSAGCEHCYAERMARRVAGQFGYPEAPHHFDVTLHPDWLEQPLHWRKPGMVFVPSMGDLFHDQVPAEFIGRVLNVIGISKQHTFQMLTKRPGWMCRVLTTYYDTFGLAPFENLWLGTSIEDEETKDKRIPDLLRTPAAVRFVSIEPMLGPVDLEPYFSVYDEHGEPSDGRYNPDGSLMLSWVIVGGESGPGARPMHPDWARDIREQCQAVGVPFFFKQMGGVRKHEAGRLLDGREWNEMPG